MLRYFDLDLDLQTSEFEYYIYTHVVFDEESAVPGPRM